MPKKDLTLRKMTPKEELFVDEYLVDFNARRASEAAGYQLKNHRHNGCMLLTKPNIHAAVSKAYEKRKGIIAVDGLYVIQKNLEIVEADLAEWIIEGKVGVSEKDFKNMPKDLRKLITSVDRSETYNKDTGDKTITYKFKLMDKSKALDSLAKHLGMFEQKIKVEGTVTHSFTDWAKEMNKQLAKEERDSIVDVAPKGDNG